MRWTAHTAYGPPFVIDGSFASVVDAAVAAALDRGLEVIVDLHHADDVMADSAGQEDRFAALWVQLGERFGGLADAVAFELLNEPRSPMTAEQWNRLLRVGLEAVRATNPTRRVLISPAAMGTIAGPASLDLPIDPHVVATVHHYEPFRFTHQGAPWEAGSAEWIGTGWGTAEDERELRGQLETAAAWASERGVPLVLSEFGTYERAALDARVRWTRTVRMEAERLQIAWCYWDFATNFGVFDPASDTWRLPLRDALLGH